MGHFNSVLLPNSNVWKKWHVTLLVIFQKVKRYLPNW
jgi:hypothetical protein